ncbi:MULTISPECIES: ABC transporter ATP-binding protein [Bacillus]|uniref:Peptide ABC transporter ATP-binding protein n=1 Tax=Bacillus pumilus (strain SAFR-032) TaxID=315750 RepID=A8F9W6_BACP2|nr:MULTISPECIES: ABC transporter ATP-binding protein [Bacillus]ABV61033.1 peptide ABC transporter ATP-binding protein [Bacillus pumilus SAFR-032]MCP1147177.1 ABC transporter ATP-binding protein [Bacillus sp. 1735sda2]MED1530900.1 ABC transporter ATP-binding protein [Bacillus altitudinis]
MDLITFKNMSKEFNSGKQTNRVLTDVNLTIKENELVMITGRSGSGKTTLLNIIAGLDKPTSGSYFYRNHDLTNKNYKQLADFRQNKIGIILQNYPLVDEKNVFENVKIPLWNSDLSKEKQEQHIIEMLRYVGLENKAKAYPKELSGGEAQRVATARALINDPDCILADEPTGSLDEESEQIIFDLLTDLHRVGKTIIIVTHNKDLAKQGERQINISNGVFHSVR